MRTSIIIIIAIFAGQLKSQAQNDVSDCVMYRDANTLLFRLSCELSSTDIISEQSILGFDNNDSLSLSYIMNDSINQIRTWHYTQYRHGFKTQGYILIQEKKESVLKVSYFHENAMLENNPVLVDPFPILDSLKTVIGISKYMWEPVIIHGDTVSLKADTAIVEEIILIDTTFNEDDTLVSVNYSDTIWKFILGCALPDVSPVLFSDSLGNSSINIHLEILAREPELGFNVILNGKTGAVVSITSTDRFSSIGTGMTLYNDYQAFHTKFIPGGWASSKFKLLDDARGDGIHTKMYHLTNSQQYFDLMEVEDGNNLWYGNYGVWTNDEHKRAISAHWAIQKSWDYFRWIMWRNSIDNAGKLIEILVDDDTPSMKCRAKYNKNSDKLVVFKGGTHCDAALALDILSHEFTHGVIKYSVNNGAGFEQEDLYFGGGYEPGALEESFADIFGNMVEYWVTGTNTNWSIGEQVIGSFIRRLDQPNLSNQASWRGDSYWTEYHYWGQYYNINSIYENSGVQNHWFYLLSMGGGSPQPGNTTIVSGIGREKAAKIAYRNLTEHMLPHSNYFDARRGSILAAADLFGACSNEVKQTINAWDAVNVHGDGTFDLNVVANCFHPYDYLYAFDQLEASCDYSADPNHKVFTAGNEIILSDGFVSNGDMHIFISPCLSEVDGKTEDYPSYGGAGAQTITQPASQPSVEQVNYHFIKIYPNPSSGQLYVQSSDVVQALSISDLMGRTLSTISLNGAEGLENIDLSPFRPGTYLLRVQYLNGKVEVHRVVRQ